MRHAYMAGVEVVKRDRKINGKRIGYFDYVEKLVNELEEFL